MSLNPQTDVKYRFRLANEHLERAEKLFSLKDWGGTISASQLSIENFAKTVIQVFEVPTWSHDPSNQLNNLTKKLPSDITQEVKQVATLAREMAPEHGRTTYGEPTTGLVPSDIYKEEHASNALRKSKKARKIAEMVLKRFNVRI